MGFISYIRHWSVFISIWAWVLVLTSTRLADYKTDAVIQRTLRTQLSKDVTVITIAHRLQTIMDSDKIVSCILLSQLFSILIVLRRWYWTTDGSWVESISQCASQLTDICHRPSSENRRSCWKMKMGYCDRLSMKAKTRRSFTNSRECNSSCCISPQTLLWTCI